LLENLADVALFNEDITMCGRYNLKATGPELLAAFEIAYDAEKFIDLGPRYNIYPTQVVPAVRRDSGERAACLLRWGLVPPWAKDLKYGGRTTIARADTVADLNSYRAAFKSRRCLIPATGWYEWQETVKPKQPFNIRRRDEGVLAFAGLWESWRGDPAQPPVETFTIITTEAAPALSYIHHRMPVVLSPKDYDLWLDPRVSERDVLLPLLIPYAGDDLTGYPVPFTVNNPRNDVPECIEPLA
jgi:putative SOS response-associated peptidase YedK